ncbi:hypothetical protein K0M31_016101, partial [Melipona bicolor]
ALNVMIWTELTDRNNIASTLLLTSSLQAARELFTKSTMNVILRFPCGKIYIRVGTAPCHGSVFASKVAVVKMLVSYHSICCYMFSV